MYSLLVLTVLYLTKASAQDLSTTIASTTEGPMIHRIVFEAEEASGSGDEPSTEECRMSYIKFEGMYLRGVKEPNHIDYNATTFEACEKRCCYETGFKCRSFSYFEPTHQCFLMNVTRYYTKYDLVSSKSHVHVEVVKELSTTTTTTVAFPTPARTPKRPESSSSTTTVSTMDPNFGVMGPDKGILETIPPPDRVVAPECPKRCLNGGGCLLRRTNKGVAAREAYCKCQKGYTGDQCEMEVSEAGGFPMWVIALIVLGGIILILFLTVCIMYHVYRKKTGEYKVVKAIQRWTRRGRGRKKLARAAPTPEDDYGHIEENNHLPTQHLHPQHLHPHLHHHTSPTTSVQSIHGSVTSSTTHSTTTSV
uniref:uncharacterized protein LOC120334834 n=1 Tax=Styela clava TaxID=7725 RepID=UPI00193A8EBB|nr:uncharacterized protein LOC120334834 [Styela clava]